ncbi:MAG: hypothetical protein L0G49_07930 [Luteococcus sp.]|uniref:hypothetical protein n=1 Tax=Luteococcus sp. TaxID=1969402 RepID=UPI00264A2596|nr:hypothetical protein [Luteococcus sp.]MDN5563686.1 hypothetical protein [Luteococcus sp.]
MTDTDRDRAIIEAWLSGERVTRIARHHQLSPARVYDILAITPAMDAERERRRQQAHADLTSRALAWSLANPGVPLDKADLGCSVRELKAILGDRAALHRPARNTREPIPDQAVQDALCEFVALDGKPTMARFTALQPSHGWPSLATVLRRHGTWAAALESVGVTVRSSGRGRRFRDEDLAGWVRRYLESPGPWTVTGLEAWLATQDGAPSGTLVRKRFGAWPQILVAAHQGGTP